MKPEQWGSLLVQEKYQEEKACDKRLPYRIIIIIIIIINAFGLSPGGSAGNSCSPLTDGNAYIRHTLNDTLDTPTNTF